MDYKQICDKKRVNEANKIVEEDKRTKEAINNIEGLKNSSTSVILSPITRKYQKHNNSGVRNA